MKYSLILIFYFIFSLINFVISKEITESTYAREYKNWKLKFNKKYSSSEEPVRYERFKKSYKLVEEQNEKYAKGESTWKAGLNPFSAYTEKEWYPMTHGLIHHKIRDMLYSYK